MSITELNTKTIIKLYQVIVGGDMQDVYKRNICLIKDLYETGFGEKHRSQPFFKYMIDALYCDSDLHDEKLNAEANKLTDKYKVKFGADGICGWKILYDVYDGSKSPDWLNKYKTIRQSTAGTLFWPCQENGGKTINIQRGLLFGDRIDLTLYDIKRYIEKAQTTRMCFDNLDTQKFLERYRNGSEGFTTFVRELNLANFVSNDYMVYDLSANDYHSEFIDDDKIKDFSWSNRYKTDKKRELLNCYLTNILAICEQSKQWD